MRNHSSISRLQRLDKKSKEKLTPSGSRDLRSWTAHSTIPFGSKLLPYRVFFNASPLRGNNRRNEPKSGSSIPGTESISASLVSTPHRTESLQPNLGATFHRNWTTTLRF